MDWTGWTTALLVGLSAEFLFWQISLAVQAIVRIAQALENIARKLDRFDRD